MKAEKKVYYVYHEFEGRGAKVRYLLKENLDKLVHIFGTFSFLVFFGIIIGWPVCVLVTVALQIGKEVLDYKLGDRGAQLWGDALADIIGWLLFIIWYWLLLFIG